jgi:hypothetical protein
MNDQLTVSTNDLKLITKQIRAKKEEIIDIYNDSLKEVILASDACFKQNGVTYEEVNLRFQKLFKDFDYCVTELVEVMEQKIVPGYEDLSGDIKMFFNKQFASELGRLLDIDV